MINPNRNYNRDKINEYFDIAKRQMQKEALERGQKLGFIDENGKVLAHYEDVYTGKTFKGGDKYEYDHIRSAENIYNRFKATHTDDEIAQIVNCAANVGVTHTNINRSKGKLEMEKMMDKHPNKVTSNEIHLEKTNQTLKQADEGIERIAKNILKNRNNVVPPISIKPISINTNFFNIPLNIFKNKKVWITSLIAIILLMSIYGMSLYNGTKNTPQTSKLEPNSNIITESPKTDVDEYLILENTNILFNKKSSIITKEDYVILQKIVDTVIKSKKNYSFSIEGYSCDLGPNPFNDKLSKLRAKNIETYLINKGLDSSKIKISWFGETKFINNGNLENSRKIARSVIIKTNK